MFNKLFKATQNIISKIVKKIAAFFRAPVTTTKKAIRFLVESLLDLGRKIVDNVIKIVIIAAFVSLMFPSLALAVTVVMITLSSIVTISVFVEMIMSPKFPKYDYRELNVPEA